MSPRKRGTVARRRGPIVQVTPAPKVEEISSAVVEITNAMATAWLEGKVHNRGVSDSLVAKYHRDMRARGWHLNGEPFIFSKEGKMLDGQHRAWAIVYATSPDPNEELPPVPFVRSVVIRGVDESSMSTIDTGRARTFSDVLAMRGHAHNGIIAAASRWLWWYDNIKQGNLTAGGGASTSELEVALRDHPLVTDAARMVSNSKHFRGILTPAIATFVVTKGLETDAAYTERWIDGITTGANLSETDPVYLLREKMRRIPRRGEGLRAAMTPMKQAALAIKSWKYGRAGRQMRALDWRNTIDNPESFPRFEEK